MARELWGTCAVNDHQRPDAFLRELLLFDRLVIPIPATQVERERWREPNPGDPLETWDPDLQDELLEIVGTQTKPGHNGARLAWTTTWDQARWQAGRSRHEVAQTISEVDAFHGTRFVLAMDEQLPGVIEAVAAYPSEKRGGRTSNPSPSRLAIRPLPPP